MEVARIGVLVIVMLMVGWQGSRSLRPEFLREEIHQENRTLRKKIKEQARIEREYSRRRQQLEQENAELKAENEALKSRDATMDSARPVKREPV